MSLLDDIRKGIKGNVETIVKCVAITLATALIGGLITGIAGGLEEIGEDDGQPAE